MAVAIIHEWLRPIVVEEKQQVERLRERLVEFRTDLLPSHLEFFCFRTLWPLEYRHHACEGCSEIAEHMRTLSRGIEEIRERSSGPCAFRAACRHM